jgi:hypothetical protein
MARPRTAAAPASRTAARALSAGDAAWLVAIPCAALTTLAIVALGPPVGRAIFTPDTVRFIADGVEPEPTEHARYLIAAAAPFAVAGLVAARGRSIAEGPLRRTVVRNAGLVLLGFAVFALIAQHTLAFHGAIGHLYRHFHRVYFTPVTIAVAVLLAAAFVMTLHRAELVERLRAATSDTRARRIAAGAIVAALLAAWMLTAFNTEGTIGRTHVAITTNVPFWLDETFAVLNGLTPLATFHAQYAQLWPYVTAGAMALLGTTFVVYATVTISATVATMVAVFATFRRVAGSSLLALGLFVPFLATSFFREQGTLANRYGPSNLFTLFPIRYGGPFVLAWLISRRLDGRRPRSDAALFLIAGLVVLNNPEFGIPAFAATLAALVWTLPQVTWRSAGRVTAAAAGGLAGAVAIVAFVTLIVSGRLPDFGLLTEFSRVYGLDGFGMLPMPTFGFHLAIYLTFAAALVLATVRAVERERDTVLTGLLCWIGVFGLGAGGYYAGRSHPEVLIDVFSPWAFALALLLVVVVRAIRARPSGWPTAAEVAVLLGFALAVCSIAQTPAPWTQISRLSRTTPTPRFRPLAMERFVRQHTVPGERTMLLLPLGHRIAYDIGIKDMLPYASLDSMPTTRQWQTMLDVAQEQGVRSIFVKTRMEETTLRARRFNGIVVPMVLATGFHPTRVTSSALHVVQLRR